MLILGGSRWSQAACDRVARFAEKFALPVCTTFRRLHLFDALHPCYAGDLGIGPNPKLVDRIKSSDLVVLIGGRMGELPSQSYTLFDIPRPQMTLRACASRRRRARARLQPAPRRSTPRRRRFAAALEVSKCRANPPRGDAEAAHAEYLAWTDKPTAQPGAVNLGAIMVWLREYLPDDAIVCNGAGNYAAWIHRFYRFRRFGTHVAPTVGLDGLWRAGRGGDEAALSGAHGGLHCRRRRFPDERAGIRDRRAIRSADHRRDLPTTAFTAPSACIRSANIPAADRRPICAIRISSPMRAPLAASARRSRRRRISPPLSRQRRQSGKPAIIQLKIDPEAITPVTTLGPSARNRWRKHRLNSGSKLHGACAR